MLTGHEEVTEGSKDSYFEGRSDGTYRNRGVGKKGAIADVPDNQDAVSFQVLGEDDPALRACVECYLSVLYSALDKTLPRTVYIRMAAYMLISALDPLKDHGGL